MYSIKTKDGVTRCTTKDVHIAMWCYHNVIDQYGYAELYWKGQLALKGDSYEC